MNEAKRIIWHSRRGMLELDVLLVPFAEQAYSQLSLEDQQGYSDFLESEDPDLFVWLMEQKIPENPVFQRMVKLVLTHAERQR